MVIDRRSVIFGFTATGLGLAHKAMAGVHSVGGHAFGSSWRVVAQDDIDFVQIITTVDAVVAQINRDMSPYQADSHLSVFNVGKARAWHNLPTALCHVASEALHIAELTDGAFDPTIGPIVSGLGFGPIKGSTGHYSDIKARSNAIRKGASNLTLDLCGIAKGYALDQIAESLRSRGITNALIEMGGEVLALGRHPDGRAWQVAVVDPNPVPFSAHRIVAPGPLALATSGHAANGLSVPISTSHIVDPLSGRSAATSLASVSVLAPTAIHADAFATALCAAGPLNGPALAHRLNLSALFITDGVDAAPEIITGAFARHILI